MFKSKSKKSTISTKQTTKPIAVVSTNSAKKSYTKKQKIIVFGVIVLLVCGAASAVFINMNNSNKTQGSAESDADAKALQTKIYEANKEVIMASNGDLTGALALVQNEYNSAKTEQERQIASNKYARLYLNDKNYAKAIEYANKAIFHNNNAQSWVIIGQASEQTNNYKAAVDAYQKAVDLTPKDVDNSRSDYGTYYSYLVNAKAKL